MRRLLYCAAACLLLCGCASSERMARLSGGVVQKHSAPRQERLRSVRFRKGSAAQVRQGPPERLNFSERSLINVWPFFFRSDDYFSALWPVFDYDPYGMALRPFYNQEGDDRSILFPLSSWNTASGDGWAALFYWDPDFVGFAPLFHQSFRKERGGAYYTPLLMRYWERSTPGWLLPEKEDAWTQFLLGYCRRVRRIDISRHFHLRPYDYSRETREFLAWKLRGTGTPVPQDVKAYRTLRDKVFATLPEYEDRYYGFIPLFFGWDLRRERGLNLAGVLGHWERTPERGSCWILLHLLFSCGREKNGPLFSTDSRSYFCIPPLLAYGGKAAYKCGPVWKKIRELETVGGRRREPFPKNLPEMKRLYKEAEGREMPEELCSYVLWAEWVREYAEKQKIGTETESWGGFLPLYCFYAARRHFFWTVPAFLTFSDSGKKHSFFLSIPLLTLRKTDECGSLTTTAGPLIWYSKRRRESRIGRPVFSRDVFRVKSEWQQHTFEDEYALCALYYHGRDGFSVARKGADASLVERVRSLAFLLRIRSKQLFRDEKNLAKREERNKKWVTKTRLDELKKMVDAEEIRLEREKQDKAEKKFLSDLGQWTADAAKLGMTFSRATLEEKNFSPALEALLEKHTETRFSEDYGSGVFYRKELDENGDFDWHIFLHMASASRRGDREKAQVLQFFYRRNREGEREEKVIFPFIAVRKDKDFRSASFLWRLWESHESPRGKGGYFLFFPWGAPAPAPRSGAASGPAAAPPELPKDTLPRGR